MTKEDLSRVVGRALMDQKFAAQLTKDPAGAAKSIGAKLSPDEVKSLTDVSATHMKSVSSLLRSKMNPKAFFDQQQQQARMD